MSTSGQRDPEVLADLARRRLRSKIPALTEALTGRFTEHHAFLAGVHLDLIDRHTEAIEEITARIEVVIEPFQGFRQLICTIPGIATTTADVIVAETGADMTRFPTAGHLAFWGGTCPGSNESVGRVKSTKTRPSNPNLQGALGAAALACAQNPGTYLGARDVARRRPTSRSSTRCSPRSGTWAEPAPCTTTRRRLLHQTPSRTSKDPGTAPARGHGLPTHTRPHGVAENASATKGIFASEALFAGWQVQDSNLRRRTPTDLQNADAHALACGFLESRRAASIGSLRLIDRFERGLPPNATVRDRLASVLAAIAVRPHYEDLLCFLTQEFLAETRIYFLRPVNRIGNRMAPGKGRRVIEGLANHPVLSTEAKRILAGRSRKD